MDDDNKAVTVSVADAEAVLGETADASPQDEDDRHDPNDPWINRVAAAARWKTAGDQRFWNELGVGQRVCAITEKAEIYSSVQQWTEIADIIAATGVAAGETLKQMLRRSI